MTRLYTDNPFALLGLRATADGRQVRRRIEELEVRLRLGSGTGGLDPDRLRQIRQALESPVDRLNAEVFWLHVDPDEPSPELDTESLNAEILRLLQRGLHASGLERTLITHDLAVLRHAAWLDQWQRTPDAATLSGLQLAHTDWVEALLSPDIERYFQERRQVLEAPPLDIQQAASERILHSIAEVTSDAIDRRNLTTAVGLVALMRRTQLPVTSHSDAVADATKSLRGQIARGLQALSAVRETDEVAGDKLRFEREALLNGVLGPFARYLRVDPTFSDDALRDRVALAARLVSVNVYNSAGDADLAGAILDHSLSIAGSTPAMSQLAADLAQVRYQHHSAAATAAFDTGASAAAAAHAELAEEYASSEEQRALVRALAGAARRSALPSGVAAAKTAILEVQTAARQKLRSEVERAERFEQVSYAAERPARSEPVELPRATGSDSRGKWVAAAIAILILLLVGAANGSSTANRSSTATQAPSATGGFSQPAGGTRAPTQQVSSCSAQIRSMDAQLGTMESDLERLERRLRNMRDEIDSLDSEIRSIESRYPRGIPSSIYPHYSYSFDRRESLIDDYNSTLGRYKSDFDDYELLVNRRNSLARSC